MEAARSGDSDAALCIGEFLLWGACAGHRQQGDDFEAASWLEEAARLHGLPMMWRIAAMAKEYSRDVAARWQRAAIVVEWRGSDSDVEVDENAFRLLDHDGWVSQEFSVRVTGEPHDAVREALTAAAPRLMSVGDDGIEYEDGEVALDSADDNPNYVPTPHSHVDGGWKIWLDRNGEAYPFMAATVLRILVDELHQAGVHFVLRTTISSTLQRGHRPVAACSSLHAWNVVLTMTS